MANSMEDSFREQLVKKRDSDNKSLLRTKTEYFSFLEELKEAFSAKSKSPRQYYILGRYEILQCDDVEQLIRKRGASDQEPIYFTHIDDMFYTIKRGHVSTGHGGRDKMTKILMVHGKPSHPQSQGSVELLNCDVKDMLTVWLGDNSSTDWPMGLRFVQFQKNSIYHSGIKQSPYKALFSNEWSLKMTLLQHMPNATVQPVANNARQTNVNVSNQV